ncbi:MAG: DNA mismatch repair endonuclease MutL, partial [Gammaproteobacteria bacterium]|nr:DNA mismatch repair endonuclease MutL [Gammaproteobacteria bacterium]
MSSLLPQQNSQPRRIRQLPLQLANQIAAGEVIERPASVVKELVENSIDAGSSQIDIVIEKGGSQLIQVTDNGHGISLEDLPIALAPHATSKIYNLDELNQILSLGFRGEALASIASISRLTLQSRQGDSEQMGWMVTESQQEPQPCAIPAGSRIAVRELFFNTPGRKRFLRTERTEFLQIEAMVRRLALSHFEIGFSLEHNGKSLLRLPPAVNEKQQLQRIGQLFGKTFVDSALQIRFEAAGMVLSGWIGALDYSITQSDRQ